MMSCGTSSRYGSSLLLKTADFSIQAVLSIRASCPPRRLGFPRAAFRDGLLCGLFERSQYGVAPRHRGVERLLGSLLPGERGLHLLGPNVAHLHHVAEAQAARILARLLAGEFLERRLQNRILLVEAVRL